MFESSYGVFLPAKEKPRCFGVFFHGYGANGKNLCSIGRYFPFMHCFFPHGLESFEGGLSGYQWFSLRSPWNASEPPLDFLEPLINQGAKKVVTHLEKTTPWLQECLKKNSHSASYDALKNEDIKSYPLVLGGFSQGAALAYHLGFHYLPTAAVMGFSGFYLLKNDPLFKPPTFWLHGRQDDVVSLDCQHRGIKNLQQYAIPLQHHSFSGGHSITDEAGKKASYYMQKLFC